MTGEKKSQQKECKVLFSDMPGSSQQEIINVCYGALTALDKNQEIAKRCTPPHPTHHLTAILSPPGLQDQGGSPKD
jgi:hypothetical protein